MYDRRMSRNVGKRTFSRAPNEDHITKTHLFKYIQNFTTKKGKKSDKKF